MSIENVCHLQEWNGVSKMGLHAYAHVHVIIKIGSELGTNNSDLDTNLHVYMCHSVHTSGSKPMRTQSYWPMGQRKVSRYLATHPQTPAP